MREDDMTFRTLGLDDSCKPRKSATPLTVGHRLVAHLIDVVDQDECDPFGECGAAREDACKCKTNRQQMADIFHGGIILWGRTESFITHGQRPAIAYAHGMRFDVL